MIRDFVKSRTTQGVRTALRALWNETRLQKRHLAAVRRARSYSSHSDLKLHLGCGAQIKQGWVNIDLMTDGADLHLDLRESLPFRDNSVAVVYSEHVFEHLAYPLETGLLLRESLRVLRPGGIFSVGVPDTEWPLKAYVNGDDAYFELALRNRWHPDTCTTRMHQINHHFRQGAEHKYAYDEQTLARVLEEAGFVSIERREFDPSLDTERRRVGTLYMSARKP
jgi:predicted SAM-dependent methyltransferase